MNQENYLQSREEIASRIAALPVHSKARIDQTARDLENASFSFTRRDLETDLFRLTNGEFSDLLESLDRLTVNQLEERPTIFDPGQTDGQSLEDWGRTVRLKRMSVLLDKYLFLIRLREGEPEAWDEVNELFSDD